MLHGTFNLSTLAESVFVLTNKCKPVASYFKSHFVVLSEIDLEEKTIGQCLWLSTKCPRSIHRVVPTSARFQVFLFFCFFLQPGRVKYRLNFIEFAVLNLKRRAVL